MRNLALGLLVYLAGASSCFGYGAIAIGENGRAVNFAASYNKATPADANATSMNRCNGWPLQNCRILKEFQNSCVSVGLVEGFTYRSTEAHEAFQARQGMFARCSSDGVRCTEVLTVQTATPAATDTSAAPEPDDTGHDWGWIAALVFLNRLSGVTTTLEITAGLIVSGSILWLLISIVSSTTISTLKDRASISAWVGLPAAVFWVGTLVVNGPVLDLLYLGALAWTDVFAALIIGTRLKGRFSSDRTAPNLFMLPIATLTFAILTMAILLCYVFYGLPFPTCDGLPPFPPFSGCWFASNQPYFVVAAALLLVVGCGVVLPADSNLVLAYSRFRMFIFKLLNIYRVNRYARLKKKKEALETEKQAVIKTDTEESSGSYPVPAIYSSPAVDAMRLKLKRSQRTGLLGKVIFVLDARMELTRDEYELLRKYRLGSDVIYESSDRLRRKEMTQAHLEMTQGAPSLRDSVGAQAWGAAKSLFWLGRASISATAAALSLRITIDALISGVHVECKSMGELLEAETAIREAAQNLRAYLDVATTFDGREEIVELK